MGGFKYTMALDAQDVKEATTELASIGQNLRPLMDIAGGIFENSMRHRFDTAKGPGGIPWPISRRAALGKTGKGTLQDKGNLRGSIRSVAGDDFVETGFDGIGRSSKHAASHQWGVTIRPRNAKALAFTGADGRFVMAQSVTLPARPMAGIDDDDRADLKDGFVHYMEERLGGN